MHALSMIDMGAKTPEMGAQAKPLSPSGEQFGKLLGAEQAQPRPEQAKGTPHQEPQGKQVRGEQSIAGKGETPSPAAGKAVAVETGAAEEVNAAPKLQQTLVRLLKVLAEVEHGTTRQLPVPAPAEPQLQLSDLPAEGVSGLTLEIPENDLQELLTQLVQQLDTADLRGAQVRAGIDLGALQEQLQQLTETYGAEAAREQLVQQLSEQLQMAAGLEQNSELAAGAVAAQGQHPEVNEMNLGQARRLLQQAITAVAQPEAKQAEGRASLQVVASGEPVKAVKAPVPPEAEAIDGRFADLLKPRQAQAEAPAALRERPAQVAGETPAAPTAQAGVVPQAEVQGEGTVEQSPADFAKLLASDPKQVLEALNRHANGPAPLNQDGGARIMPEGRMVQLPSGQQVAESQIFDQVVSRVSGSFNGESGRMVLRLNPAELGSLKLELVVEGDRVRAQLHAQTQQVQEVLERHLPQLRSALAEQGLKIDQFRVDVDPQRHPQGQFGQWAEQQQQQQDARPWQPRWAGPWQAEEQIIPLDQLLHNGGGGISLHV